MCVCVCVCVCVLFCSLLFSSVLFFFVLFFSRHVFSLIIIGSFLFYSSFPFLLNKRRKLTTTNFFIIYFFFFLLLLSPGDSFDSTTGDSLRGGSGDIGSSRHRNVDRSVDRSEDVRSSRDGPKRPTRDLDVGVGVVPVEDWLEEEELGSGERHGGSTCALSLLFLCSLLFHLLSSSSSFVLLCCSFSIAHLCFPPLLFSLFFVVFLLLSHTHTHTHTLNQIKQMLVEKEVMKLFHQREKNHVVGREDVTMITRRRRRRTHLRDVLKKDMKEIKEKRQMKGTKE